MEWFGMEGTLKTDSTRARAGAVPQAWEVPLDGKY